LEAKDPSFERKYGNNLKRLQTFFSELGRAQSFPLKLIYTSYELEYLQGELPQILPTQSSYFGLKGNRNIRQSFRIDFNDTMSPKPVKQKRFIGVGYRDKGTRRNIAHDGSPSWQEVASESAELEQIFLETFNLEEERKR
jgi:hypothetical protein